MRTVVLQVDPLHQFVVQPIVPIEIGGLDISFTNASLWMVISAVVAGTLMLLGTQRRAVVPNRLQVVSEMLYDLVASMVRDNVGGEGRAYFPFIFTLFVFILFGNILGLIPSSFTFTSHIVVTFALAAFIFIAVTFIGIVKHGIKFFTIFLPGKVPWFLAVLIVPIEIVSYLSRPISLSVRLFANMTVGHIVLKIIAGFIVSMGAAGFLGWLGVIPTMAFLVAIHALELLIAVIQAYIFAILSCIYLNDAIHLHH